MANFTNQPLFTNNQAALQIAKNAYAPLPLKNIQNSNFNKKRKHSIHSDKSDDNSNNSTNSIHNNYYIAPPGPQQHHHHHHAYHMNQKSIHNGSQLYGSNSVTPTLGIPPVNPSAILTPKSVISAGSIQSMNRAQSNIQQGGRVITQNKFSLHNLNNTRESSQRILKSKQDSSNSYNIAQYAPLQPVRNTQQLPRQFLQNKGHERAFSYDSNKKTPLLIGQNQKFVDNPKLLKKTIIDSIARQQQQQQQILKNSIYSHNSLQYQKSTVQRYMNEIRLNNINGLKINESFMLQSKQFQIQTPSSQVRLKRNFHSKEKIRAASNTPNLDYSMMMSNNNTCNRDQDFSQNFIPAPTKHTRNYSNTIDSTPPPPPPPPQYKINYHKRTISTQLPSSELATIQNSKSSSKRTNKNFQHNNSISQQQQRNNIRHKAQDSLLSQGLPRRYGTALSEQRGISPQSRPKIIKNKLPLPFKQAIRSAGDNSHNNKHQNRFQGNEIAFSSSIEPRDIGTAQTSAAAFGGNRLMSQQQQQLVQNNQKMLNNIFTPPSNNNNNVEGGQKHQQLIRNDKNIHRKKRESIIEVQSCGFSDDDDDDDDEEKQQQQKQSNLQQQKQKQNDDSSSSASMFERKIHDNKKRSNQNKTPLRGIQQQINKVTKNTHLLNLQMRKRSQTQNTPQRRQSKQLQNFSVLVPVTTAEQEYYRNKTHLKMQKHRNMLYPDEKLIQMQQLNHLKSAPQGTPVNNQGQNQHQRNKNQSFQSLSQNKNRFQKKANIFRTPVTSSRHKKASGKLNLSPMLEYSLLENSKNQNNSSLDNGIRSGLKNYSGKFGSTFGAQDLSLIKQKKVNGSNIEAASIMRSKISYTPSTAATSESMKLERPFSGRFSLGPKVRFNGVGQQQQQQQTVSNNVEQSDDQKSGKSRIKQLKQELYQEKQEQQQH